MKRSEKFWDRVATRFDRTEKRFEPLHIKTMEQTKRYLKSGDTVLDYGCATGTKTLELANHPGVNRIQGIDISSNMIDIATRRAVERNIENVEFAQATIFDERYTSESFDVILAFNILHLLDNTRQAVQRMSELLKPGGVLIATTPCLHEKMAFVSRIQFSFFFLSNRSGGSNGLTSAPFVVRFARCTISRHYPRLPRKTGPPRHPLCAQWW
jgi:2-polyprenyl-3-methyl-5-hydroxy-6-metoxy-1,4-benzoquinol methylase